MLAETDVIDNLVSEGLREGHLAIDGIVNGHRLNGTSWPREITNLEQYLLSYGPLLGKQAERSLAPLHVPEHDPLPTLDLLRSPFAAQKHVIEAMRKALKRQKSILLVGEMGTGKSLMGLAAVHAHADGRPYRALIFCPGQLVNKWEREIKETIPGAEVIQIESWKNLLNLQRTSKPTGAEWFVIPRDRAKLGAKWRPACLQRSHMRDGFLRCPQCGRRLVDDKRDPIIVGQPGSNGLAGTGLWKRRSRCEWVLTDYEADQEIETGQADRLVEGCGSPLWQTDRRASSL